MLRDSQRSGGTNNAKLVLTERAKGDITWWLSRPTYCPGRSLITASPDAVLTTDASNFGWGAVLDSSTTAPLFVHGKLPSKLRGTGSSRRELFAVDAAVHWVESLLLQGLRSITVMSDNVGAVAYVRREGGRMDELSLLAEQLHRRAASHGWTLRALHLPGAANIIADSLSRYFSPLNEARVRQVWFLRWIGVLKPSERPTADMFASADNALLPLFVPWAHQPGCWAVNALVCRWPRVAFAFPPPALISPLLLALPQVAAGSLVYLVTPTWSAQPWWPLLLELALPCEWPAQAIWVPPVSRVVPTSWTCWRFSVLPASGPSGR
jgi:hypothetical protein